MNIRRLFLSPGEAKKHKRQIVNRGKWLIKPKVWKFLQKCGSLKRSTRFSSCVYKYLEPIVMFENELI